MIINLCYLSGFKKNTEMEARQKQLIIMYHEIRRLRDAEHFSFQRIADKLKINFRTVKKILGMTEEDYDRFY